MRVTSLIILLVIIGAIGYVALFQRQFVMNMFEQGGRLAKGYAPAKTPTEAMEGFAKAVKAREYKTAADLYVTGKYGEQLAKMHKPARDLGVQLDNIVSFLTDKGLNSEKTITVLYYIDAFPGNFDPVGAPKTVTGKTYGIFKLLPNSLVQPSKVTDNIDKLMLQQCLMSPFLFTDPGVEIIEVGEGNKKSWKLNIPLPDAQYQAIDYFNQHYKSYLTGLTNYRTQLTNDRIDSKATAERDILTVFRDAK